MLSSQYTFAKRHHLSVLKQKSWKVFENMFSAAFVFISLAVFFPCLEVRKNPFPVFPLSVFLLILLLSARGQFVAFLISCGDPLWASKVERRNENVFSWLHHVSFLFLSYALYVGGVYLFVRVYIAVAATHEEDCLCLYFSLTNCFPSLCVPCCPYLKCIKVYFIPTQVDALPLFIDLFSFPPLYSFRSTVSFVAQAPSTRAGSSTCIKTQLSMREEVSTATVQQPAPGSLTATTSKALSTYTLPPSLLPVACVQSEHSYDNILVEKSKQGWL